MTDRTLTYQNREFVKGDTVVFEVWQCQATKSAFRTTRVWERVAEFPSFKAAEAFISERAGGYYRAVRDYAQDGSPINYYP